MASFAPALLLPPSLEAEQLALFENLGPNVAHLRAAAAALRGRAKSAATKRAYESDWKIFAEWCGSAGRSSLPAAPETVLLFVASELQSRAPSTVERRLAAIAERHKQAKHPSPVTSDVRDALAGWRNMHGREQREAKPIMPEDVAVIAAACSETPLEIRDRLMVLVGFATGMRRSEISALNLADVEASRAGVILRVRRSKTDQQGKGRAVPLHPGARGSTDPLYWLSRWLDERGRWDGPLFVRTTPAGGLTRKRLTPRGVGEAVKRACVRAGLEGGPYTAHSLRAGLVTHSLLEDVPEAKIMAVTGHRSHAVLSRYARFQKVLRIDLVRKAI